MRDRGWYELRLVVVALLLALTAGCGDGSGQPADVRTGEDVAPSGDAPEADVLEDVGSGEPACAADPSTVLRIHYQNGTLAPGYADLHMWTWGAWSPEKDVVACAVDEFGAVFDLPREWFADPGATLGYKFKKGAGSAGPWYEFDRAWTEGVDCWEVWVLAGDGLAYCDAASAKMPKLAAVWWDSATELQVRFSKVVDALDDATKYRLDGGATVEAVAVTGDAIVEITTSPLDVQKSYTLTFTTPDGDIENTLFPRRVLDPFVTDEPLGSGVGENGDTWFRVFAPRATRVTLHIAATASGAADGTFEMTRDDASGTWDYELDGNLHGTYYWYTVDGPRGRGEKFDPERPLNDPYAFVALSSFGPDVSALAGRGMVFDVARLGAPTTIARAPIADLVAWEVHVRDLTGGPGSGLTADDPDFRRYLGFTREGLRGPAPQGGEPVKTGLDHIVELGVNAVQLLPVEEFPADPERFNWGYFTANFFSPEGMYASSDEGEAKALELKALVDALHAKGVAVVLDIVFNHSAEGSDLGPYFNFKGFDSKYYYRQDPYSHSYANGSGVGNELWTERPMVRRFLLDAIRHWVTRYGIDGFRFDLAALLDKDTIEAIAAEFPDIYLYGEPWAASGALWGKGALNDVEPWCVFNDTFRDAVKGSPEGGDKGFVQGGGTLVRAKAAVTGNSIKVGQGDAWADAPADGLLYMDAHDNLTLADKLEVSIDGLTTAEKEARVKLGAALTLTSLGPVMLHAGVEFLRSKPYTDDGDGRPVKDADSEAQFDANSYASTDATNNLDWGLKALHFGVFRFVSGMIHLRLSAAGAAARPTAAVVASYVEWHDDAANPHALGYTLNADRSAPVPRLRVLLNTDAAADATFDVDFPAEDGWRLVADGEQTDPAGLAAAPAEGPVVVPPLGIRIFAELPDDDGE